VSGFVTLDGVRKQWSATVTVGPLSFGVAQGEILALLGPSGSGKTTVLRLLAGFETSDAGRIGIGDEDVTATPPARRRCGMVFQHYALFPHLDVGENVAFGLAGQRKANAGRIVDALKLVGLEGFERRRVQELSGGQQQRVAIARALANDPPLLIGDEMTGDLDTQTSYEIMNLLVQLNKERGTTIVFVTHDPRMSTFAHRVIQMRDGKLADEKANVA
jgi:ABC-type Fe3+/spermidine/putrescine transport system ATPase subunit